MKAVDRPSQNNLKVGVQMNTRSMGKVLISLVSIACALVIFNFMACSTPSSSSGTNPIGTNSALSISPATINLAPNGTTLFAASGGTPPYGFYRASGSASGIINAASGAYTAYGAIGTTDTIQVVDSASHVAYATVTISATGTSGSTLAFVSPPTSLGTGNSYLFTASGGTGSYKFYRLAGTGTMVEGSGYFTAPFIAEAEQVQVVDSGGATATATFSIVVGGSTTGTIIEIYRLYNSANQDLLYSTQPSEGTSLGFTYQGAAFQVYAAAGVSGTTALNRCRTTAIPQTHFLSISSDCEGKIFEYPIGYVYSNNNLSGSIPLYRFSSANGKTQLVTTSYNEGTAAGLQFDVLLGFAFAP